MCAMIKNYVNQKNRQNVSYTINPDHRQIDLYFTRDRRVLIVGTADNNYIFWLSVSACEDEAATGEAFNQITRQKWDTHTALYLALEEAGFPDILETKCRIREAGGRYFLVLQEYLRILNEDGDDPLYYMSPDVRAVSGILKQEQYLILSGDIKVREYYHAAKKKEAELYNRYMTAVR